jgi:hypothetical protein
MHILRLEVKTNDEIVEIMPILSFKFTNEEICSKQCLSYTIPIPFSCLSYSDILTIDFNYNRM